MWKTLWPSLAVTTMSGSCDGPSMDRLARDVYERLTAELGDAIDAAEAALGQDLVGVRV